MKKILFLVIFIFALIINVFAMTLSEFENLSETEARAKVKEKLTEEYPDNYTTIKFLLDDNMEAFKKLKSMYPSMSEAEKRILERLLNDYDCSFSTVLFLYAEEVKAMKELSNY